MSTARVSAVVFDLAGVLCAFRPERRLEALARATGRSAHEVEQALFASGFDARADRGEIGIDAVLSATRRVLWDAIGPDELLDAWAQAFALDEAVVALAAEVSCHRCVLTNNGPLLERCVAEGLVDLGGFEPVLCTWRLGAQKPDRRAFAAAEAELAVSPEKLLLVDDTARNVEGAARSGWQAHRFVGLGPLRQRLVDAGVLEPAASGGLDEGRREKGA